MLKAIVCVDKQLNIGYNNELLVCIPEDLKRFKELTTGSTIIMGRNTFLSLPDQKPLPNRKNIVISRHDVPNCEVSTSIESIIKEFSGKDKDAWVIGGESIYEQLVPYCSMIYLTLVDYIFEGANKKFPKVEGFVPVEKSCMKRCEKTGYDFMFWEFEKTNNEFLKDLLFY